MSSNLRPMATPAERRIKSGQSAGNGAAPAFKRLEVNRDADKNKKIGK